MKKLTEFFHKFVIKNEVLICPLLTGCGIYVVKMKMFKFAVVFIIISSRCSISCDLK